MGRGSREPDKTETGMERPREETDEPHPHRGREPGVGDQSDWRERGACQAP